MRALALTLVGALGCSTAGPAPRLDAAPAPPDAPDAGRAPVGDDASPPSPDGGARPGPRLAVVCDDTPDDVYAAVPDVSAPLEGRGRILACAVDEHLSVDELARRLALAGVLDVAPRGGITVLRVAFQTTRRGGAPAVSSARVLVPDALAHAPSPAVVTAHPTAGLADECAPSRIPGQGDALNLPWAAAGLPVIAPDYAGLGTDGVQGYGDNDDTARSVLDGGRALEALLPVGALGGDVVVVGHSQGGGVALSVQALERTYGTAGHLLRAIALAPGWPVGASADPLRDPDVETTTGGGLGVAVYAMFVYAWLANERGEDAARSLFAPPLRDEAIDALLGECVTPLGGTLSTLAPTWGALFDPLFAAQVVACADGGLCLGDAGALWSFMESNRPRGDAEGAPALLYAGTGDTITPPESIACIADLLARDGVASAACLDDSTHFGIVARNVGHAVRTTEALLDGTAAPACPSPTTPIPVCP